MTTGANRAKVQWYSKLIIMIINLHSEDGKLRLHYLDSEHHDCQSERGEQGSSYQQLSEPARHSFSQPRQLLQSRMNVELIAKNAKIMIC